MAMSQPPLRTRPNLHLASTDLTGSPRQSVYSTPKLTTRFVTPYPTPGDTPSARTSYSLSHSAGLTEPAIYETPEPFASRRTSGSYYRDCTRYRIKRVFTRKSLWLLPMVLVLLFWWFYGSSREINVVKLKANSLGKGLVQERRMHDYQFFPATNPKIHVGPW